MENFVLFTTKKGNGANIVSFTKHNLQETFNDFRLNMHIYSNEEDRFYIGDV